MLRRVEVGVEEDAVVVVVEEVAEVDLIVEADQQDLHTLLGHQRATRAWYAFLAKCNHHFVHIC